MMKERIAVCARRSVVLKNVESDPSNATYSFPDKYAYLLRDVILWPELGAVVDEHGRLIEESIFSTPRRGELVRNGAFRAWAIREINGPATTIAVGPYWDNYYHWLVDSLPRVFALNVPRVAELGRLQLLVSGCLSDERRKLLTALLPSTVEIVEIEPRTRIRARSYLLLPFLSGDCAGYLPLEYLAWFRERAFTAFGVRPDAGRRRRILISRQAAVNRRITNGAALEAALRSYGFETLELERLSWAEQMRRFSEAECVVGAHGAGLTNLLYAPPCHVLELFAGTPKPHYRLLSVACGHDYLDPVVGEAPKNADFAVPVDAIVARLEAAGIRPLAS
jgi:capsular polysaccharide biosynthesis protein